jgi:hypothetical protein
MIFYNVIRIKPQEQPKGSTVTEYPRSQRRVVKDSKGNAISDSNTSTNTNTEG